MDPEDVEYLKREERRCAVPSLIKNLGERSLGHLKKNVTSREYRELVAEELLIEKEKYDELCCEMPGMPRSTFLMVFSPDGTKVASTHGNHNIYVTDIRSGKNMRTLIGHPRTPWCIAFHPTSNQIVASGCLGGQVRIWDLSGGSEVWTATNQTVIASIAFHPIERILVIATSNEVYFWDWSMPEPFLHTSTGSHKEKVRYVAFDKLGHRLITGISNSHSRWEYVRSSERTYDPPMRHFNIASRRPVLRRGLFPVRQNVRLSPTRTEYREAQSRVPERERNITMSYRNLVRQYGRLVQRYLQLYRPPAMIDRGTDPMDYTVPSGSSDTTELQAPDSSNSPAELQEPNSSNSTTELQEPVSSNSTTELQEPVSSNSTTELQEPVSSNSTTELQEPVSSNSTTELQEPVTTAELQEAGSSDGATELQQESHSSNNLTGLQESDSSQAVDPSDQSNKDEETRMVRSNEATTVVPSVSKKHKNDSSPQNDIPRKKLRTSRSENGDNSASTSQSPPAGSSGLLNRIELSCREMIMNVLRSAISTGDRTDIDRSETNQDSYAQTVPVETEDQEPTVQTDEPGENSLPNNQEADVDSEEPIENAGNIRETNTQTENLVDSWFSTVEDPVAGSTAQAPEENPEASSRNSRLRFRRIPRSRPSRIVYDLGTGQPFPDQDRGPLRMTFGFPMEPRIPPVPERRELEDYLLAFGPQQNPEEAPRSAFLSNPSMIPSSEVLLANGITVPDQEEEEEEEPLRWNLMYPSVSYDSLPGTSGEQREQGDDQRLENMMMNMRRNAEDNLRARFMPLIRSRVPENDREELIRLFEESVRESREKARLRYRNMGQTFSRPPNQRPFVIDSSDSSSSEDERDSLHMNFYVRSRTDSSSRATESPSGTGSGTQRSRGNGVPSGNNSYHNINNLESWVTSLFNDVDSSSANTNEMSTDTAQTSNTRWPTMNINTLLDRPPRMNSHTTYRTRNYPNASLNNTSTSLPESPEGSPPNPAGNTSTGTTNSTSYSLARRRLGPGHSQRPQVFGIRPLSSPTVINNFPRDELINFAEFPNSEDDPFVEPERSEPFPASSDSFHPFNPPPNLPAINPENIGIGNMYSNIVHDLETSLNNARDSRTVDRPGEMSNMLSNFSNRLETLMNQSEGILRNLRTSVEVLPDNDPIEYAEEAPVPTASFNDSSFFVRDQRIEEASPGRNFGVTRGFQGFTHIPENNATSDHTYPRNSESASSSSNMNESMSPLMNSLHLTLSHIQSQSRLLHRQVECIERIDRAMVEVAQLQLMRLLLVELSTYVRNMSGESRSTSMSSVRQMMAGTRISDASPGDIQRNRDGDDSPVNDPGPSTSSGSRGSSQSSSARSRGLTRKTYPPSRLNRPREQGYSRSTRNSQDQPSPANPQALPSVAPPHTYSEINLFTLIRMDRRLQSLIDDHSTRFSYLNEHFTANSTRRTFHEVGEHTLALRLRESITRTNRLIGNIFNANVVRNYRIDSSTSLRHGIERYYERTLLSLIIDGISSHLDENRTSRIPSDIRTRMQNVLQLAMMMSDLLLLYTINSLAPTTDVNLESERNILANRIAETCTTMIQCRQYRNFSNIFVQSLRSLRLMVSAYCTNNHTRLLTNRRRGSLRPLNLTPDGPLFSARNSFFQVYNMVNNGQVSSRESNDNTDRESNETTGRESNDTPGRESNDTTGRESNDTTARESNDTTATGTSEIRVRESSNSRGRQFNYTRGGATSDTTPNNSPLINACLYLARRQRAQSQSNSNPVPREVMAQHLRNILRENRNRLQTSSPGLLRLRQRQQEPSILNQSVETNSQQNEGNGNGRTTRRRNSTDHLINAYLTAGRNRTQNQSESTQSSETDAQQLGNWNSSSAENRTSRSNSFNPFRDMALITSHSGSFRSASNTEGSSRNDDTRNGSSANRTGERTHMFSSLPSLRNDHMNNASRFQVSEPEASGSMESQPVGSNMDIDAWWESAVEHLTSEPPEDNHRNLLFGTSSYESSLLSQLPPPISPIRLRPSTSNNTTEASEPSRYWRIPSVQVNDVPLSELGPSQESSESDNSPNPTSHNNNNNSTYPRVMARLATIRSMSVYNQVLRPRLLHPLYATLNPFDADLEQREHIYDSDVISTVTPNHRIQVWDISDSRIPDISDPLKNLVVRECKIHNDASVDIASDGSILVTLLPSGGYLNITNRLGVYSLRWETLGQCLYTTSFVHNAVSVSLSPLGRHLVVGLASRRVSLLPNDRWMMASIFKIEEKDTPGDHLPFVRQIDRGTDERATSHKSVNCIRWLPTSGQGLIYATNTGQLNIWT